MSDLVSELTKLAIAAGDPSADLTIVAEGNAAVYEPSSNRFLVKASGVVMGKATIDDWVYLDLAKCAQVLVDANKQGVTKKLVGFEMIEKGIARHDYEIKDASGNAIGVVTSGTQAPSLNKAIGMGYVTKATAAIDTEIFIAVRDRLLKAKVVKVNIIGKPYATANYTKGNHYLSFGKFKIASAAVKLKTDMKKRAGIETDVILVDGSYRVVVPFLSKEKAEEASKDYLSTTLFE